MSRFELRFTRLVGPHSAAGKLAKLDGRTREARLMRDTRRELVAHCGGSPSATQRQMIEQAVQLTLRLALMDAHFSDTGELTATDSKAYLGWSNALVRLLARLGLKSASERPRSLQQHLAARVAA